MGLKEDVELISEKTEVVRKTAKELQKRYEGERERLSQEHSEIGSQLDILISRIKQGESTGDSILDFGVVNFRVVNQEELKKFRELYNRSREAIGEPVLVSIQSSRDVGPRYALTFRTSGIFGEGPHLLVENSRLMGILNSGIEFRVAEGDMVIPIEKHVVDEYSNGKWKVKQGPIVVNNWCLRNLGKRLTKKNVQYEIDNGLQVDIGAPVDSHFWHGGSVSDSSYYLAMKLLEGEAPSPFKQAYTKEVSPRAVELVNEVESLRTEERNLADYIKRETAKAVDGKVRIDDGERYSCIPLERHLSPETKNLEGIRRAITNCLQETVESGIYGLGIKVNTGAGLKPTDIDEQIRTFANAYDFNLE